eukprot:gene11969-5370_t
MSSSLNDEEKKEEIENYETIDSARSENDRSYTTPSPATFEISEILKDKNENSIPIEKNLTDLAKEVEGLEIHTEQLRKRKLSKSPNIDSDSPFSPSPKSPNSAFKAKTKFLNLNVGRRSSTTSPITVSPSVANIPSKLDEKGIKKSTKIFTPVATQKLFTEDIKSSSVNETRPKKLSDSLKNKQFFLCVIILLVVMLTGFFAYRLFFMKKDKGVLMKNFDFLSQKNYKLTNLILKRKLANACQYNRNEPLSFLFSSNSFKTMNKTTQTIVKALNQDAQCSAFTWNLVYLDEENIHDWRKIIIHKLMNNPATVFVLDISNIVPYQYDFMTSAMDGSNAMISYENLQIRPVKSIFIWLTDYGAESFDFVRKSTPQKEEQEFKRKIMMKLEMEWPDRIRHRLNYLIPFVKN